MPFARRTQIARIKPGHEQNLPSFAWERYRTLGKMAMLANISDGNDPLRFAAKTARRDVSRIAVIVARR
jgi:hypothetical protein